jgi:predicted small lipoprotein YifL
MYMPVSVRLVRAVLVFAPAIVLSVSGCGESGPVPNTAIVVDKAAEQAKQKMVQEAYKNQKPARTEAQSKSDMIKASQKPAG